MDDTAELLERYASGQRNFTAAVLRDYDLSGKDLRGIILRRADLRGANLRDANLSGADLSGTHVGPPPHRRMAVVAGCWLLAIVAAFVTTGAGVLTWFFVAPRAARYIRPVPAGASIIIAYLMFAYFFWRHGFRALLVAMVGTLAVVGVLAGESAVTSVIFGRSSESLREWLGLIAVATTTEVRAWDWLGILGAATGAATIALGGAFCFSLCQATLVASRRPGATCSLVICGACGIGVSLLSWPRAGVPPFILGGGLALVAAGTSIGLAIAAHRGRRAMDSERDEPWIRRFALRLSNLGGTSFVGADLSRCSLRDVVVDGCDLRGAVLSQASFRGCQGLGASRFSPGAPLGAPQVQRLLTEGLGVGARLEGLLLSDCDLSAATLRGARLRGTNLERCNLADAQLQASDLRQAELCGACLAGADLTGADLRGAKIDVLTYQRSRWAPEFVQALHERGITVVGLDCFPLEVQSLFMEQEGLSLHFRHRVSAFDRHLIEGLIFGMLGPRTSCRLAEFREMGELSVVRLVAAQREELERLAEAFYRNAWASAPQPSALLSGGLVATEGYRDGLTDLRRSLDRLDLRAAVFPAGGEPVALKQAGGELLRSWEVQAISRASDPDLDGTSTAQGSMVKVVWSWALLQQEGRELDVVTTPKVQHLMIYGAPEDADACKEMKRRLKELERQKLIASWYTGDLPGGAEVALHLGDHFNSDDIIVLLISPDFTASDKCMLHANVAFERHKARRAVLIPVLLRPSSWDTTPYRDLPPLPGDRTPLVTWANRDAGWENIVGGIRLLDHRCSARAGRPAGGRTSLVVSGSWYSTWRIDGLLYPSLDARLVVARVGETKALPLWTPSQGALGATPR